MDFYPNNTIDELTSNHYFRALDDDNSPVITIKAINIVHAAHILDRIMAARISSGEVDLHVIHGEYKDCSAAMILKAHAIQSSRNG